MIDLPRNETRTQSHAPTGLGYGQWWTSAKDAIAANCTIIEVHDGVEELR